METRLIKTTGNVFCLFGLFFFIKNLPIIWYLNSVSHSTKLNVSSQMDELLFWGKFLLSIVVSVVIPFTIGLNFLKLKKG